MTNTDDTDDVRQTILYGELHELRVALEASLARLNALIAEMDERDRAWQERHGPV